jgi:hypothetical protein
VLDWLRSALEDAVADALSAALDRLTVQLFSSEELKFSHPQQLVPGWPPARLLCKSRVVCRLAIAMVDGQFKKSLLVGLNSM